jgi:hypothetical protein
MVSGIHPDLLHCFMFTHMQFSSEAKSAKGILKETGRKLISDLYQLEATEELCELDAEGTCQMIGLLGKIQFHLCAIRRGLSTAPILISYTDPL